MGQMEDLQLFVQVVENESISKAASHLGIAKSAVSRRLALLEDHYQTPLIVRTARNWSLTEAGRVLYDRALLILEDFAETNAKLRSETKTAAGRINLTIPQQFGAEFISPMLLGFMQSYPDIHLHVELTDRMVDLIEERYDLAIRIAQLDDSSLISRKLGEVSHVVCASPEYLAKFPQIDEPEGLSGHRILQFGRAKRFKWNVLAKDGRKTTVSLKSCMNTNSGNFLASTAAAGGGIAKLPEVFVRKEIETGSLEVVFEDWPEQRHGIFALYPEAKHLPYRTRLLLDYLVDAFRGRNSV